ncbi:MAG: AI-2E family transporter [Aestuariibacter sp.]|jgi:putative permease|uniref:AI-2E family transporter n=1 Tax=Marisediminitalea aggregata TaxID=634436 RepID=UPI000C4D8748|nr:AI-2E family transporter [Marisediminitalea aggregata]MBL53799.1 AI-2E family transporter [Alteromonadaceae bacterium]MCP3866317.1 AI-2E family transporter [Aestuariibacter sp.]MCP4863783.1 AI-2E family transporter [Alteromonas sp.]BBO27904.1 AI-2E family transporter [Alteromonas sp. I4]MCP4528901.1 AI-2E family transporter [Aestuariibacter sp.]|tara:strand:- start:5034 stop:6101 length:1068 start_codon:yes stop_codon:yes gene_type:complete
MLSIFGRWYKRKFSDPDATMLLILILITSAVLVIWGNMLMPVIVAAIIAYLLDWPVSQLTRLGMKRTLSCSLVLICFVSIMVLLMVGLVPVVTKQSMSLVQELPNIWQKAQDWLLTLPDKYPEYVQFSQIYEMMEGANQHLVDFGQEALTASFSSIASVAALLIYLILVPLMVFFMLKDKPYFTDSISRLLPRERRLITQVGNEMNVQIANYIRGKVIEIIIVGAVSCITFAIMDLRYSLLLGVLVGLSVLIPYIGAAVVTIPVAVVAMFQWGITPEFWYLMVAYGIIQALDGNLLVPILFSEAVSLHPLYIIVAVLFFGGLWGFWGVFFAIPLATLVKAVVSAWSSSPEVPAEP